MIGIPQVATLIRCLQKLSLDNSKAICFCRVNDFGCCTAFEWKCKKVNSPSKTVYFSKIARRKWSPFLSSRCEWLLVSQGSFECVTHVELTND